MSERTTTVDLTQLTCPECACVFDLPLKPADARAVGEALLLAADERFEPGELLLPDDYKRGMG